LAAGTDSGPLQARQQLLQGGGVHRLGQVVVEAGLRRPPLVLLLTPAGDRHQRHAPAPRLLADPAGGLEPVELRHPDVEQRPPPPPTPPGARGGPGGPRAPRAAKSSPGCRRYPGCRPRPGCVSGAGPPPPPRHPRAATPASVVPPPPAAGRRTHSPCPARRCG